MTWPLTILHLSDLHFGPHGRFAGEDKKALAERFHQAIEQARSELGWKESVGLCIVTGDVAEAARPGEYEEAREFFEALIGRLGLARPRVIFAPGNHDVSWHITKRIELERDELGFSQVEFERRIREEKFRNFEQFLARFHDVERAKLPGVQELGHGAFVHSFPEECLAVAVLNSCERESHFQQGGALSREQAQALMSQWQRGEATGWIKLVAVHHNPVATVPVNVRSWVTYLQAQTGTLKPETIQHFAADAVGLEGSENLRAVAEDCHVQLVLHGHHHAAAKEAWHWTKATGHTLVLSAGSWGLRPDKLPGDQPNMMHLVRIDPASEKVQSVLRIFDPRARAEGHVQSGHFTVDPANAQGAPLRLSVPEAFREERVAPDPVSLEAGKAREFIQEYRTRLKRRFERWELGGVGSVQSGGAGKPLDATLDDMYLPLRLAAGFDPGKLDAGHYLEPAALLAREKPLVVRGAAGSGKTTWMRWTFRRLVETPGALPFMVELRRLSYVWSEKKARGAERTLDAYLRDQVAESGASGWEEALPQVFKARTGPRPVLLVDGWDELGELGEELRDKLIGFLEAHPRVLAVVSSRPYGQSRPSGGDGFEVLDLQPLSDAEIFDFTHRFHHRVYGEDATPAQESTRRFQDALKGSPEALSLARTPLLLTMMLLISRDRPLPDKRHLLYEECIRNLLSARPEQRELEGARLQQGQWRPSDSAERWRAVAALAFQMQTAGYKVGRSQIVQAASELERMLPESWKHEDKRGFLAWLVGAAGVLIDRADGTLTFAHLSFQEYLTAHHLAATMEGDEARHQVCQERMGHMDWWETLRLWAAIIGDRNPAHLSPVLRRLIQGEASGFWLTGAILADGLGHEVFMAWCEGLAHRFHLGEDPWSNPSARAWRVSRQDDRRRHIAELWPRLCAKWTWLAAIFAREWSDEARIDARGENTFERMLRAGDGKEIGRSRVLFGANPVWPAAPEELVLLRLFPSQRRVSAAQLQMVLSLGGSRDGLERVANRVLIRRDDQKARDWARDLARDLTRDWAWDLAGDLARDLARDWAWYSARNWVWDSARDSAQEWGRDLARNWAWDWARNWTRYWTRDVARDWARDWAQYWARNWTQYWMRDVAPDRARDWVLYGGRDVVRGWGWGWLRDLGYQEVPEWAMDWLSLELASPGRAWTRAVVARSKYLKQPHHVLLREACVASLNPGTDHTLLKRLLSSYPKQGDLLWPALARHLARCSTAEDRALLTDLAQHPEKRSEPLSSGLKYYVRGDLVFEDGTELTLDALCDELGLPRLPYLEEMQPELELD